MRATRVIVMLVAVFTWLVSSAVAGGPRGGGGGGLGGVHGNAGGQVRGLNRAEEVAAPQGLKGIEKAEEKIEAKDNPRNPNTQDQDSDTTQQPSTPKSSPK